MKGRCRRPGTMVIPLRARLATVRPVRRFAVVSRETVYWADRMGDIPRFENERTGDYPICPECVRPVGAGQSAAFKQGYAVHVQCGGGGDSGEVSAGHRTGSIVLYIDDNPSNVRLVDLLLEQRPAIRFVSAESGRIGLDLARERCPDVILLDLHLPDIDGIEVLSAIRRDPLIGRTPVIVLSAENNSALAAQVLAAGAQSYLTKPLNLEEFFAALDAVLLRGQPRRPDESRRA
jgi:CheY-like chemotaxis protein